MSWPIRWFRRSADKTPAPPTATEATLRPPTRAKLESLYERAEEMERRGDAHAARATYQRVINSGDPHFSSLSALNVGVLLARQGDITQARAYYQLASDLGYALYAPTAAFNLGLLAQEQGDLDSAIAAYRQAIASGHPDQLPKAAINLGLLRKQRRDFTGARAAFQQAIDSGHPDCAHLADILDVLLKPTTLYFPAIKPHVELAARRVRQEAGVDPDS